MDPEVRPADEHGETDEAVEALHQLLATVHPNENQEYLRTVATQFVTAACWDPIDGAVVLTAGSVDSARVLATAVVRFDDPAAEPTPQDLEEATAVIKRMVTP